MRKRFLAMVIGLVLTASMITGCAGNSSSDSSSNTASSSDVSSSDDTSSSDSENSKDSDNNTNAEIDEYTVYGKVTSVSNDGKVTYEVLSKDENQPQMPQGSGAPDAKNGEKPQMPQSGAPDAKNGGIPRFKSTGKTSTVTLSENVTVQKAGMGQTKTDASISDIKKGSIIGLVLDGDNVTKVLIREDTKKGGMEKQTDSANSTK